MAQQSAFTRLTPTDLASAIRSINDIYDKLQQISALLQSLQSQINALKPTP